jgi:ABC-type phosphate transport system substrate-binding protein
VVNPFQINNVPSVPMRGGTGTDLASKQAGGSRHMSPGRVALRRTSFAAFIVLALSAATTQNAVARADATFQVIVHADIEGSQIKRETLSSVFLGEVTRWGSGQRVMPVDQSMRSPVRALFTEQVLSQPFEGIEFYWADMIRKGVVPPPVKKSDAEVIEYVARTKGAIGYVSLGAVVPAAVKTVSIID